MRGRTYFKEGDIEYDTIKRGWQGRAEEEVWEGITNTKGLFKKPYEIYGSYVGFNGVTLCWGWGDSTLARHHTLPNEMPYSKVG